MDRYYTCMASYGQILHTCGVLWTDITYVWRLTDRYYTRMASYGQILHTYGVLRTDITHVWRLMDRYYRHMVSYRQIISRVAHLMHNEDAGLKANIICRLNTYIIRENNLKKDNSWE